MKAILHLSYDLRDNARSKAPTAVRDLIALSRTLLPASVVDLRRVHRRKDERTWMAAPGVLRIDSAGLSHGLLLRSTVRRALDKIRQAQAEGLLEARMAGAIHAHKSTFEGYIGYFLSQALKIPLFLTLRVTDLRVFALRPDLLCLSREVLRHASTIFYAAPYMIKTLGKLVGRPFFDVQLAGKMVFLPNIVERPADPETELPERGRPDGPGTLLTVLRMTRRWVRLKNLRNLLRALRLVPPQKARLQVIGGGEALPLVRGWAARYGLAERVDFIGEVPNARIDSYLRSARGLVLPSHLESFGMVYAEALLNGTPILYSQGTGFDGMFPGVGVAVDPACVPCIAEGLLDLLDSNERYRQRIAALRSDGSFRIFSREHVREVYAEALRGGGVA